MSTSPSQRYAGQIAPSPEEQKFFIDIREIAPADLPKLGEKATTPAYYSQLCGEFFEGMRNDWIRYSDQIDIRFPDVFIQDLSQN